MNAVERQILLNQMAILGKISHIKPEHNMEYFKETTKFVIDCNKATEQLLANDADFEMNCRTAEWIDIPGSLGHKKCSNCGIEIAGIDEYGEPDEGPKYCFNCGCKMIEDD